MASTMVGSELAAKPAVAVRHKMPRSTLRRSIASMGLPPFVTVLFFSPRTQHALQIGIRPISSLRLQSRRLGFLPAGHSGTAQRGSPPATRTGHDERADPTLRRRSLLTKVMLLKSSWPCTSGSTGFAAMRPQLGLFLD
ncbi:hypothetical protein LJR220_003183 [Bradyrhizobium sp. LjRoot220]|uniref:hypothetical protein n=1 Tax=Bradyrhizobium sp. LjRoot220 TaxID=3342284 RepID=UPI003ECE88B7